LFTKITVHVHKFARVYFSYDITMRNMSSLRKCISLYWLGNVKLFVFTYYGCQGIKRKYAIFSVKWSTSIHFNMVISFIYFNRELQRKDSIPFILWSWYHPWSACLYIDKWVEMSSSYVNIVNVRVFLAQSARRTFG
jgi:hypothetical protein